MTIINNLSLKDAKPTDIPHLLLWDTPNNFEIYQLSFKNDAKLVSYREDLLSRINCEQKFLTLEHKLDQELEAIRKICANANKPVVLLKDLDILITYLYSKPQSPISLFWKQLEDMRHLQSILWLIFPTQLNPLNWNEKRKKILTLEPGI